MFDRGGPTGNNKIRDLTVGDFEHLYIRSKIDMDINIKYAKSILQGAVLKNRLVMLV